MKMVKGLTEEHFCTTHGREQQGKDGLEVGRGWGWGGEGKGRGLETTVTM